MSHSANPDRTWRPNVTVAAVVHREGRFLLVEEQDAVGTPVLNQPAGHLEPGESLVDAVRRETLEETGWHIEPTRLVGVYRWPRPDGGATYLRFAFAADVLGHEPERELDDGILRCLWLSQHELDRQQSRHRSPLVATCIRDWLAGPGYPLDCLRELS